MHVDNNRTIKSERHLNGFILLAKIEYSYTGISPGTSSQILTPSWNV